MTFQPISGATEPSIEVLEDLDANSSGILDDARVGLTADSKWLPPKYFYDDRGSRLFDAITELPEYYPTRAERELLRTHGADIIDRAGCPALVELGSGSSEKTTLLIEPLIATHADAATYVPFDVSLGALRPAVERLHEAFPGVRIDGVVGDVDRHLADLPQRGPRLIAFLGGTLGNYAPGPRHALLRKLRAVVGPDEAILIGIDLVKDPDRLVRAYDDAAGVTAAFNRNVLHVLNDSLGSAFDPELFAHVAHWDPEQEWIEMRLRARQAHQVELLALGLTVSFDRGEDLRTEISAKFRRDDFIDELAAVGLAATDWWTDGDYALVLSRPASGGQPVRRLLRS